jgi:two-component sensor histidine kinase
VLTADYFFLPQNLLLLLFCSTAALLVTRELPVPAINVGLLPAIAVYTSFQTARLVTYGSPAQIALYIPLLLLVNTQIAALVTIRWYQVVIAFAISVAGVAVSAVEVWSEIVAYPVASTAFLAIMLLAGSMSVVAYRFSRVADREMRHRSDLVREVHHRLKNETGILLGLIDMELAGAGSAETRNALKRERRRVKAVLSTHNHLFKSRDFARLALGDYIAELSRPFETDFEHPDSAVRIDLNCPEILVSAETAVSIGLALNEFLVNSLKHAIPRGGDTISIDVQLLNRGVRIRYTDNGPWLSPRNDDRGAGSGFGMRFVEGIVATMHGSIHLPEGSGFTAILELPAVDYVRTRR